MKLTKWEPSAFSAEDPWVGVDLDGTLAYYDTFVGEEHIGDPIPEMVSKVQRLLAEGRRVKIFTARCSSVKHSRAFVVGLVQQWLEEEAGLPRLEVTNEKDWYMIELWDDRARRVEHNTGEFA